MPCEAIIGEKVNIGTYDVNAKGVYQAYCLSEESMQNLLENIVKMETYRFQLLELLKAVANVEVDEE